MRVDGSAAYAGPDRRRPVSEASMRPCGLRMVFVGLAVAVAWCLLAILAGGAPARTQHALIDLARAIVGALLLAAAALRFANWRITGTARSGWIAIVLAAAGAAMPALAMLNGLTRDHTPAAVASDLARGLIHLTLIGLCAIALGVPAVVSWLRPVRIASAVVIAMLLLVAVAVVYGPAIPADRGELLVAAVLRTTVVGLWIALAIAFVAVGWRRGERWQMWTGAALVVPVASSVAHALFDARDYAASVIPTGIALFVAILVAGASALALWQVHSGRGNRFLRVSGELRSVRVDLLQAERDQASRLHDARSAILALSGAARLLGNPRPSASIDPADLSRIVTDELHRIGAILDPQYRSSGRPFRPAELLAPLVLAHRLSGSDISTEFADAWATGKPEATATAVGNLLSNARAHAPGARIWLTVEALPALRQVRITVADDGPGISSTDRLLVLEPGFRGHDSIQPGFGLGLPAAARLMSEQGGTLSITGRAGGGTVVTLTLPEAPVAGSEAAPAHPHGILPNEPPAPAAAAADSAGRSGADRAPTREPVGEIPVTTVAQARQSPAAERDAQIVLSVDGSVPAPGIAGPPPGASMSENDAARPADPEATANRHGRSRSRATHGRSGRQPVAQAAWAERPAHGQQQPREPVG